MKKYVLTRKYLTSLLILTTLCFYGCLSDCSVDCPTECIPISFVLMQDGINILEKEPIPFQINSMRVESIPVNPEAPSLLGINNKSYNMVVCQNVEYILYLNDSTAIEITAKLDTFSIDHCCVYFTANSIKFNGDELCSDQDQCGGGIFELN